MRKTKRLFAIIFSSIFLLLIALALGGATAPWLAVSTLPPLQLLPALAVIGIPLYGLLFVLLRKRLKFFAFLAFVALLASLWVFAQDIRIPSRNQAHPEDIKLLSFNIKNFNFDQEQVDSVLAVIQPIQADIICFQEFRNYEVEDGDKRALAYLAQQLKMPYHLHFRPENHYQGVALLSKYPIVDFDTLYMDANLANNGFLATVQTPDCKLGVGNFHLNSFRFTPENKEKDTFWERMKYLFLASWETVPVQAEQIKQILAKTDAFDHPLILTADMNAVRHSALVKPFADRYQDAFQRTGSGLGWTFPLTDYFGIRIDFHWLSQDIQMSDFQVLKKGKSDHYPILGTYSLPAICE